MVQWAKYDLGKLLKCAMIEGHYGYKRWPWRPRLKNQFERESHFTSAESYFTSKIRLSQQRLTENPAHNMEPYNLNSGRTGKSTSENYTVETFQENYAPKSSKPLKYSCENVDDESGSWSCVDGKVDTPGSFCDKCTYMFHPGWINVGTETEGAQGYDGASTSQEAFQSGSQPESSDPDNFIVVHRCQWYYIKTQDPRHTYCDNWVSIIGTSCYECLVSIHSIWR